MKNDTADNDTATTNTTTATYRAKRGGDGGIVRRGVLREGNKGQQLLREHGHRHTHVLLAVLALEHLQHCLRENRQVFHVALSPIVNPPFAKQVHKPHKPRPERHSS